MTDLISNVLDLTRLESGQVALRRDWETLDDLAATALQRLGDRARAHQFVIDLAPDLPAVHVDGALIVQLFGNLFDNVVKYTPAGTRARVSAVADGAIVRVTVDDDGPGFPAGDPERLFDKFQRGEGEPATVGRRPRARDLPRHRARARRRDPCASAGWAAARVSSSRFRRRSPRRDRGHAPGAGGRGRAGHPARPARAAGGGTATASSRRTRPRAPTSRRARTSPT